MDSGSDSYCLTGERILGGWDIFSVSCLNGPLPSMGLRQQHEDSIHSSGVEPCSRYMDLHEEGLLVEGQCGNLGH